MLILKNEQLTNEQLTNVQLCGKDKDDVILTVCVTDTDEVTNFKFTPETFTVNPTVKSMAHLVMGGIGSTVKDIEIKIIQQYIEQPYVDPLGYIVFGGILSSINKHILHDVSEFNDSEE